jgi:hypothetical protein
MGTGIIFYLWVTPVPDPNQDRYGTGIFHAHSLQGAPVGKTIWVRVSDPTGYGYEDNFLPAGDTCTRSKSRQVRDGYFFSLAGNPTGTRYFTIAIILGCEQLKMCSFCYINYDLF